MIELDLPFLPVDVEMIVEQKDAEDQNADNVPLDIIHGEIVQCKDSLASSCG